MAEKKFPKEWVDEKRQYLKATLSFKSTGKLFYPSPDFYTSYKQEPRKGLQEMADKIFEFLGIERNDCIIDFYEKEQIVDLASPDTAGFYTKIKNEVGLETEVIMINADYYMAPIAVAAILAHETMHLLLLRQNIKLEDVLENELLTDLATIETGLGILTLNAMFKFNHIWITVFMAMFGRIYWNSGEHGYGYFAPKEYADHVEYYLNKLSISKHSIGGYINPMSRSLLGLSPFKKYKNTSDYFNHLRTDYIKTFIIRGVFIVVAVVFSLYYFKP